MPFSGRSLLTLGLATSTAVVTLFACGVDQEKHLPGLPDMLPNTPGGAGFTAGILPDGGGVGGGSGFGGAGGATGATGAGGGVVIGGQAQSLCDVVAASNVASSQCATCINQSVAGACLSQKMACMGDALCGPAEAACAGCGQSDSCIEQCLDQSALYQQLVLCEDQHCGANCGVTPPLPCTITDGG